MLRTAALVSLFACVNAGRCQLSVFGHKNPDTDAVCAAIVYSWELNSKGISSKPYRLGVLNPETQYVLHALGVEAPPLLDSELTSEDMVAIVDTNHPDELPAGILETDIHSIIDHHKLSGLATSRPLEIDARPLCSTGSILYARAKAQGIRPPKWVAGLMLSCILSDSLKFKSPTTTETDKMYAAELAKISGIDIDLHADAMLDAKARISHLGPRELLMMDSKLFHLHNKHLRISVIETTKPGEALAKQTQLQLEMEAMMQEDGMDEVLLFVVDINEERAIFIGASEASIQLVERAWDVHADDDGMVVLPGVLSRKKQIVPKLEETLKSKVGFEPQVRGSVAALPLSQRSGARIKSAQAL